MRMLLNLNSVNQDLFFIRTSQNDINNKRVSNKKIKGYTYNVYF